MIALAACFLSLRWVVWTTGYDFSATIETAGFGAVINVECVTPHCPDLEIRVQSSYLGKPHTIGAHPTLRLRSQRIFSDGFESGAAAQWRERLRPDGIIRLLVAMPEPCAGLRAVVESQGIRDTVILGPDCSAVTTREHGGDVVVQVGGRLWAARLPEGQIKLGKLGKLR